MARLRQIKPKPLANVKLVKHPKDMEDFSDGLERPFRMA
jgi:hypothetical protein